MLLIFNFRACGVLKKLTKYSLNRPSPSSTMHWKGFEQVWYRRSQHRPQILKPIPSLLSEGMEILYPQIHFTQMKNHTCNTLCEFAWPIACPNWLCPQNLQQASFFHSLWNSFWSVLCILAVRSKWTAKGESNSCAMRIWAFLSGFSKSNCESAIIIIIIISTSMHFFLLTLWWKFWMIKAQIHPVHPVPAEPWPWCESKVSFRHLRCLQGPNNCHWQGKPLRLKLPERQIWWHCWTGPDWFDMSKNWCMSWGNSFINALYNTACEIFILMDFDEEDALAVTEIQRIFIRAFDFHKANEYPTFLEQIHYFQRFW